MSTPGVASLRSPDASDAAAFGLRASRLAKLCVGSAVPVAPGFAVSQRALREALVSVVDTVETRLREASEDTDFRALSTELGAAIADASFDASFRDELATAWKEHCDGADVLVRRSRIDELRRAPTVARRPPLARDVDELLAGIQGLLVRAVDPDSLRDAVGKRDDASAPDAVSFPPFAIIVQRAEEARAAGICMTRVPNGPTRHTVSVHAALGLGVGVRSGTEPVDGYLATMRGGQLVLHQRRLARKQTEWLYQPGRGIGEVDVDPLIGDGPALTTYQLHLVVDAAMEVERAMGAPQEITWIVGGRRCLITDVRPLGSAASRHLERTTGAVAVASSFVSYRGLPLVDTGPVTAELGARPSRLAVSWAVERWQRAIEQLVSEDFASERFCVEVAGSAGLVLQETLRALVQSGVGEPAEIVELFGLPIATAALIPEAAPVQASGFLQQLAERFARRLRGGEDGVERIDRLVLECTEALGQLDASQLPLEELGAALGRWTDRAVELQVAGMQAGLSAARAARLARSAVAPGEEDRVMALLDAACSERPPAFAAAATDLLEVARALAGEPAVVELLGSETDNGRIAGVLLGGDRATHASSLLSRYLSAYGVLSTAPLDPGAPRWRELPDEPLAGARALVVDSAIAHVDRRIAKGRAEIEALQTWGEELAEEVGIAAQSYARSVRAEGSADFGLVVVTDALRQVARAIGRHLVAAGALSDPDEVFRYSFAALRRVTDPTSNDAPDVALGNPTPLTGGLEQGRLVVRETSGDWTPIDAEAFGDAFVFEEQVEGARLRGSRKTGPPTDARVFVVRSSIPDGTQGRVLVGASFSAFDPVPILLADGVVADRAENARVFCAVAQALGLSAVLGTRRATELLRDGDRVVIRGRAPIIELPA